MKIIAAIATAGRRDTLTQTVDQLARQTRLPDQLIICPASPQDCDDAAVTSAPFPTTIVRGAKGLPSQRNLILRALEADLTRDTAVVFFDDDFYPCSDFLSGVEQTFLRHPDAVGITGTVLADGRLTLGVSHDEALSLIARGEAEAPSQSEECEEYSLYGCNMAFRMQPVWSNGLQFDEALPLYGWLEDLDFTRQLAKHGRILKTNALRGVHLATKSGRTSGLRFGYSQIANPLHIHRKGLIPLMHALRQIGRNVAMNVWRAPVPEPWIDRRGRLRGNLLALKDLCTGKLDPRNITSLN